MMFRVCLLLQYLLNYKAVRVGEGDSGGQVLRETTEAVTETAAYQTAQ